jgi:hypothetical protein
MPFGTAVMSMNGATLRMRSAAAGQVAQLTEALALWRGQPLTGVSGPWVEGERARWQTAVTATLHRDLIARSQSPAAGLHVAGRVLGALINEYEPAAA